MLLHDYITSHLENLSSLSALVSKTSFEQIYNLISESICNRQIIFLIGNGGSAATAIHIAQDFRYFLAEKFASVRAIDLCGNSSAVTAISNDFSFEQSFSRQLQSLANKDDLLIAYSVSGTSRNIVSALQEMKNLGGKTALMRGGGSGAADMHCDIVVEVPSSNIQHVEELHLAISHAILIKIKSASGVHDKL